jgi:hypothetical protein
MLGIGLKLLGVGRLLKEFFFNNWKWLVPLILVAIAFFWTKDHYYDLGKEEEKLVWEKKVEAERKKNEELTKALAKSVDTFGKVIETRNEERKDTEIIRENRINTIIQEKPIYQQCLVDQEVVDQQNAIKALGPRP